MKLSVLLRSLANYLMPQLSLVSVTALLTIQSHCYWLWTGLLIAMTMQCLCTIHRLIPENISQLVLASYLCYGNIVSALCNGSKIQLISVFYSFWNLTSLTHSPWMRATSVLNSACCCWNVGLYLFMLDKEGWHSWLLLDRVSDLWGNFQLVWSTSVFGADGCLQGSLYGSQLSLILYMWLNHSS